MYKNNVKEEKGEEIASIKESRENETEKKKEKIISKSKTFLGRKEIKFNQKITRQT